MGRLEKIVVCTVLFLVAAILGISLSTDPQEGPQASGGKSADRDARADTLGTGAGNPDAQAERRLARERALREQANSSAKELAEAPGAVTGGTGNAAPGGVMSTSLAPRADGAQQDPAATPGANAGGLNQGPALQHSPSRGPGESTSGAVAGATSAAPVAGGDAARAQPTQPASTEFLVSRVGLAPTASDEFMTYTWQAGDSFRALAQRFYGSPLHVKRLRDANEGRDEAKLAAGDTILVTVKPTAQGDRLARPSARDAKANDSSGATVVGGTYTVGSGDVLGAISQKVYGTASKWRTIYDANRDVIGADPNRLKPGMVLRIPQ